MQSCKRHRTTSVFSEPPLKSAKLSPFPPPRRRRVTWSNDTDHLPRRQGLLRPRRETVTVFTRFTKIATPPRKRTSSSSKGPKIDTLVEEPQCSDSGDSFNGRRAAFLLRLPSAETQAGVTKKNCFSNSAFQNPVTSAPRLLAH